MSTPFAVIEGRVNDTVAHRLANAIALVGGVEVPVMFDKPFAAPFGGEVDAAAPECTGPEWGLGSLERDSAVSIGGIAYEVETAEADGHGFVRLVLRTV